MSVFKRSTNCVRCRVAGIGAFEMTGGTTNLCRFLGAAEQFGNRYKGRWTVACLLVVLDERADSIRLEPPESENQGFEFCITKQGIREYHQVKRQHPFGNWTFYTLAEEGVFTNFITRLRETHRHDAYSPPVMRQANLTSYPVEQEGPPHWPYFYMPRSERASASMVKVGSISVSMITRPSERRTMMTGRRPLCNVSAYRGRAVPFPKEKGHRVVDETFVASYGHHSNKEPPRQAFGRFGLMIQLSTEPNPESTDGRRESWASWDEGAYQGESLGSMGTDVTRQRVFSSRTGLRERSGNAGNRVIVRLDAAGCARGAGGREFGGVGSVADSAVRTGAAGRAIGPGRG